MASAWPSHHAAKYSENVQNKRLYRHCRWGRSKIITSSRMTFMVRRSEPKYVGQQLFVGQNFVLMALQVQIKIPNSSATTKCKVISPTFECDIRPNYVEIIY